MDMHCDAFFQQCPSYFRSSRIQLSGFQGFSYVSHFQSTYPLFLLPRLFHKGSCLACIPPPQRMLFCSPILLSQLSAPTFLSTSHTQGTKSCPDTQQQAEQMRRTNLDDQKKVRASGTVNGENRKCQEPAHSVVPDLLAAEGRPLSPLFLIKPQNLLTAVPVVGRVSLPVHISPLWVDSRQSPRVNIPTSLNNWPKPF